jgi:hypothetical protein
MKETTFPKLERLSRRKPQKVREQLGVDVEKFWNGCQGEKDAINNRPLAKVDFRPPRPPILGSQCGLGVSPSRATGVDLGGIPGFMQEV